jgi:Ca2+/Na+ antiporter
MKGALCRNPQGIPMAEMSPLARVLMGVLRKGSWVAAAMIVLFAGVLCYQRYQPGTGFVFRDGDFRFLGILVFLLLLAVYLVRAIKKELKNPGG